MKRITFFLSLIILINAINSEFIDLSHSQPLYNQLDSSYHFSLKNIVSVKNVNIELTCYFGNCLLPFIFSDKEMTQTLNFSFTNGKRKIIASLSQNIAKDYFFPIQCKDNCYFQITAIENSLTQRILEKGITNVEHLSFEIGKTNYIIKADDSKDRLLVVNGVNCVPWVTFKTPVLNYQKKFFQTIIPKGSTDYEFMMKIEKFDSESENSNEICSVLIDVIEENIQKEDHILIEGALQYFNFTQNIQQFNFKFLNLSGTGILDIDYSTRDELIIELYKDNRKGFPFQTRKIFQKKVFLIDNIKNKDLIMVVKKTNNKKDIPFSIIYKTDKGYPFYFQRNKIYTGYMLPLQTLHYFTEIKKKEKGKIIVNFSQGGGKICTRVKSKDEIDKNSNWLKKVDLSQNCIKDQVNKNEYEQVIELHTIDTFKCRKGCEVYVTISNQEKNVNNDTSKYLSEFTIYYAEKGEENSISINLNQDIYGDSLTFTQKTQFFDLIVPVNTNKLLLDYDSNIYRIIMNFGKDNYPSIDNCDFSTIENGLYSISSSSIGKTTFKDLHIKIGVTSQYFLENQNQFRFKIIPQYQNKANIIYTRPNQRVFCNVKNKNDCYLLVHLKEYQNITSFLFSSYNVDYEGTKVKIFASFYNSELIDPIQYDSNKIDEYFPSQRGFGFYNENNIFVNNTVLENQDMYAFVTIIPEKKGKIAFMFSVNDNIENTFNYYLTNPKMYFIKNSVFMNLYFYLFPQQNLEIKPIYGNGTINNVFLDTNKIIEEVGLVNFTFSTSNNNIFAFLVQKYEKPKPSFQIFNDLMINNITYQGESFPFRFSVCITDKSVLANKKPITLNIKIIDIIYNKFFNFNNNFDISAYLVDEDFVKFYQYNRNIVPENSRMTFQYFQNKQTFLLQFIPETLNPVVYLRIDNNFENKNNYKQIIFSSMIFYQNRKPSLFSLPHNKFIFNYINEQIVYTLLKKDNNDLFFYLEFGFDCNSNEFLYSIESYTETPTFKNETEIIKKSFNEDGLHKFILYLPSFQDAIILSIISKKVNEKRTKPKKMVIKYISSQTEEQFLAHSYNRQLTIAKNSKTFTIIAENIFYNDQVKKNIVYYLQIYDKKKVSDIELIENIQLIDENEQKSDAILPFYKANVVVSNQEKTFSFNFNSSIVKKSCYFSVYTVYLTDNGEEMKIGYNIKSNSKSELTPDHGSDPQPTPLPQKENDEKLWVFLIILGIIIVIIVLFYFCYLWRKKRKSTQIVSEEIEGGFTKIKDFASIRNTIDM